MTVDYTKRVTVPIRDRQNRGKVAFLVDVYGVESRDLLLIPGGAAPLLKAVNRLGLDPDRFYATLWDVADLPA